jgi:lactoylglutathione lyase
MKFGYAIFYVDDVEQTLGFYEQAFGLARRFLDDAKNYGELETGDTRLAFARREFVRTLIPVEIGPADAASPAPPVEIGMTTDDVEGAFARALAAGAGEVKRPTQKPWGQIVGYVRDPNGFLVEICTPMP